MKTVAQSALEPSDPPWKDLLAVICSSFNIKMHSSLDKIAATDTSALISLASPKLSVVSRMSSLSSLIAARRQSLPCFFKTKRKLMDCLNTKTD